MKLQKPCSVLKKCWECCVWPLLCSLDEDLCIGQEQQPTRAKIKSARRLICLFLAFILIFSLCFWNCCYFSLDHVSESLLVFLIQLFLPLPGWNLNMKVKIPRKKQLFKFPRICFAKLLLWKYKFLAFPSSTLPTP